MPDFLIIGAQKSGTTYLYQNLLQHPLVEGAYDKEVHFFDRAEGGADEYRRHFPPRRELPRGTVVGEKSPSYLYFPHASQRAAGVVPDAKLVVLLRNPVDRAYSHYHHSIRLGRETLGFEEALDREAERIAVPPEDVAFRAFSYATKGIYVDQIVGWLRHFSIEQMLVIQSERMYRDPPAIFTKVQRFLGVPELNLEPGLKNRLKGRYREPMNPVTRQRLEDYFEPHNQRLYEYLDTDFRW